MIWSDTAQKGAWRRMSRRHNVFLHRGPDFAASPTLAKREIRCDPFLEETKTPLSKFKESLKIEHLEKNGDIKEIILTDMDETNPMKLKKPTEVYYEIYKKAREKARQAKKNAIKAYLEAKRIKNTFLLDEVVSSDESDNDCTINFNT